MKRVLFFILFTVLAELTGFSQSVDELLKMARPLRFTKPDSAELLLSKALKKLDPEKDIYLLSRVYNMYGTVHYVKGNAGSSDSLYKIALALAEKDKNDSIQIFILNNIGQLYLAYGTLDEAASYYNKALVLAQKKKLNLLVADSYNNLGTLYMQYGMNQRSIPYFEKGIEAYKSDKRNPYESEIGIADISNNIGDSYFAEGKFDLAFQNFFSALKTFEKYKLWDKATIASNNIAEIYFEKANYNKSKEYAAISMEYIKKSPSVYYEANLNFVLGKIYEESRKLDSSEYFYKNAITLYESINQTSGLSSVYNSIASLYEMQKKFPLANSYYQKALNINRDMNDTSGVCINYFNLASLSKKQGNIGAAEKYNQTAMSLLRSEMNFSLYAELYGQAADIAAEQKQFEKAYRYIQMFNVYRDSIRNVKLAKQQEEIEAIYQNQKKEQQLKLANAENDKKTLELKTSEETSKRKSTQLYAALAGALLLMVLIGFVVRSNIQRKKTNQLLQEKNELISRKKEEVEEQRKELALKNEEIEEKNKEIMDSINYAQRIQYALLAQDDVLKENLPEHFVLFKPKDIVSGDFYWATNKNDKFYLAVCDCTGHGVPGAFMSLLNISYLNEAITEKEISEPNKIFDHVRDRLIENVSHGSERQDGMDGILLCIDKANGLNHVKYAAAYNVPVLVRGKEVIALNADKMPVGKGEKTNSFNLHEIEVRAGDTLYVYTDGYADQFGGPKGKKFKYKQLEELLVSVNHLTLQEQSKVLNETIESWRGGLEQVDDVLVAGIRF